MKHKRKPLKRKKRSRRRSRVVKHTRRLRNRSSKRRSSRRSRRRSRVVKRSRRRSSRGRVKGGDSPLNVTKSIVDTSVVESSSKTVDPVTLEVIHYYIGGEEIENQIKHTLLIKASENKDYNITKDETNYIITGGASNNTMPQIKVKNPKISKLSGTDTYQLTGENGMPRVHFKVKKEDQTHEIFNYPKPEEAKKPYFKSD